MSSADDRGCGTTARAHADAANPPLPGHTVRLVPSSTLPRIGCLGVAQLATGAADGDEGRVDLETAVRRHAVRGVVSLAPAAELEHARAPLDVVRDAVGTGGADFDHFPLPAGDGPPPPDLEPLYVGAMTHVADRVAKGETILFHTIEGDRRAALALASVMALSGVEARLARWASGRLMRSSSGAAVARFVEDLARMPERSGGPQPVAAGAAQPADGQGGGMRPTAPPTSGLAGAVTRALQAVRWRFDTLGSDDATAYRLAVTGRAGTYSMAVIVRDRLGVVNVHLRLPILVPEERRTAVAVLVSELNRLRVIGSFEVGAGDGVVAFRADVPAPDVIPSDRTVGLVLAAASGAADDVLPRVARVAFASEDPLRVAGEASS